MVTAVKPFQPPKPINLVSLSDQECRAHDAHRVPGSRNGSRDLAPGVLGAASMRRAECERSPGFFLSSVWCLVSRCKYPVARDAVVVDWTRHGPISPSK